MYTGGTLYVVVNWCMWAARCVSLSALFVAVLLYVSVWKFDAHRCGEMVDPSASYASICKDYLRPVPTSCSSCGFDNVRCIKCVHGTAL